MQETKEPKQQTSETTNTLNTSNVSVSLSNGHHSEVMKICVTNYLKDIKGCQNELERVLERYLKVSEPLKGIDYSNSLGVDVSCTETTTDDLINRIEAWECYTDVMQQVAERIEQASELINRVNHGYLLYEHYVKGIKWSVLAIRDGVERMTIWRRKEQAINELYCLLPEEYRRYSIPNAEVL